MNDRRQSPPIPVLEDAVLVARNEQSQENDLNALADRLVDKAIERLRDPLRETILEVLREQLEAPANRRTKKREAKSPRTAD